MKPDLSELSGRLDEVQNYLWATWASVQHVQFNDTDVQNACRHLVFKAATCIGDILIELEQAEASGKGVSP